jgi:hypothetical protein
MSRLVGHSGKIITGYDVPEGKVMVKLPDEIREAPIL